MLRLCQSHFRTLSPYNAITTALVPESSVTRRCQHGVVIIVVMGVSGTGKSAIGTGLGAGLGWPFAEGDAFHSTANRAKMAAGTPLIDDDRWPWLRDIAQWIAQHPAGGVVACSALRRPYRDVLRAGGPDVRFVHLVAPAAELDRRLRTRAGHFMPASLLASQLDTLEPLMPDEPGAVLDASNGSIAEVLDRAVALVRGWLAEVGDR